MGIRWTEEEAIEFGFRKNKRGDWELPRINNSRAMSKSQSSVRKETMRPDETKKNSKKKRQDSPRFAIIVTSYRKRHLDPDNLCPKWYIDEIVRAGVIPDDSSKYIEFIKKCVIITKEEERTVIRIEKIPNVCGVFGSDS